jgi:hypothetical protein
MHTYTWKKYLPVIRLLLKKALVNEQSVTLNKTDFDKNNKLKKHQYTFSIEMKKFKLVQINKSALAKDLVDVLGEDEVAKPLLRQSHYLISLDGDYTLRISSVPEEITEADKQKEPAEPAPGENDIAGG